MASQAGAPWLEILKDRSSQQIEAPVLPADNSSGPNSKAFDARIPSNPRPLTRQASQRSINTLSVYPGQGLKRSSSLANIRGKPPGKATAPPLPQTKPVGQPDLPLRQGSKNVPRSKTVVDRQPNLQGPRRKTKANNGSEGGGDFYSRMSTPRGRRTTRPGSIITVGRRKVSTQMAKLGSKSPAKLGSPLPISPMSRQGPADEMFSDSGSLPSPNLDLVKPLTENYTPVATPLRGSLAPAPLNLSSTPKRRQNALRPDSTAIPASNNLESPNLSPTSRYSPTPSRQPSPKRKNSTASNTIPRSLSQTLLTSTTPSPATRTAFIRLASTTQLSLPTLSTYLLQERMYLHALTRFLALLLSNILLPQFPSKLLNPRVDGVKQRAKRASTKQTEINPLTERITNFSRGEATRLAGMKARIAAQAPAPAPVQVSSAENGNGDVNKVAGNAGNETAGGSNVKADSGERLHDWIIARLGKARRELDVLDELAEDFPSAFEGSGEESGVTGALVQLFNRLGNAVERKGKSVLTGLVLLLARENANMEAWKEIKEALGEKDENGNKGVVREYLVKVWGGEDVVRSVEELGKLVDLVWVDRQLGEGSIFVQRTEEGERVGWKEELKGLRGVWDMVVDVQNRFWPDVGSR